MDEIERRLYEIHHRWREILERRLNQIGSMVEGNQKFQANRIADVMEQIEELRKELAAVKAKQEKIAEYVKANVVKKKEGEG